MNEEQQSKVKAKLDELKMKRAGKIPQNAKVEGVKQPERPSMEEFNAAIKVVVDTVRGAKLHPDQIWHLGAELQLLASNDMVMNGLNSMGVNIEGYMKTNYVSIKPEETEEIKEESLSPEQENEQLSKPVESSVDTEGEEASTSKDITE